MTPPLPFLPLPHRQLDPDPRGFHSLLLWAGAGPEFTQCPPTSWFLISAMPSTQLPPPTHQGKGDPFRELEEQESGGCLQGS